MSTVSENGDRTKDGGMQIGGTTTSKISPKLASVSADHANSSYFCALKWEEIQPLALLPNFETVTENVTAANDAAQTRAVKEKRWRPSGKKVYKPHLATKVKWALEDSMQRSIAAQRRMRKVLEWLEETRRFDWIDVHGLAHLGKLEHELLGLALDVTEMDRILTAAIAESQPEAKKHL